MEYIGNGFSINMIPGNGTIKITEITQAQFIKAGETAHSIIGHPEIAEVFGLPLNRESITLEVGDIIYVVTPQRRPHEGQRVENGAAYKFVPMSEGYVYKKVELINE